MEARGRSARRLVVVAASALLAAAIIVLLLGRERPENPGDSHAAPPGADPAASDADPAGADAGMAAGSEGPLQPLELGNLDEVPWQYRDRAEEEAARRAAIERVRKRAGSGAAGIESVDTQVSEVRPITGDGPESGRPSPAIASLPGPGEAVAGDRRIGPALPPGGVPHASPEAGGLRRPSAGPALPSGSGSSEAGPELAPADPDAPGPGA
jgi:hypothetical protein